MINQIKDLFGSELDFIDKDKDGCINIHLNTGECIKMYDTPREIDINIPCCNFCKSPALNGTFLFGDDNNFICSECASEAVSAFLKNNVNINIRLEEEFKDCINNLNKITKK